MKAMKAIHWKNETTTVLEPEQFKELESIIRRGETGLAIIKTEIVVYGTITINLDEILYIL